MSPKEQVRNYELEKVESYAIRARNIDEAMEILNELDNSAAFRVDVRVIYTSEPIDRRDDESED